MSWAIRFFHDGRELVSRFPSGRAVLPVSTRRGAQVVLGRWGRRPGESGVLPLGGWAHRTHLQSDVWAAYAPRPALLPVYGFAERDVTGRERWFKVSRGSYLQGCVARAERECRIYVVTLDCAPDEMEFERWPRLVTWVWP